MGAPPSGTVTFLFTDVEGSTRLWEQHPEAMKRALTRHDSILRAAIETHGGHVYKLNGDAFCAAFHTAPEALAAALAAQRALHAEPWGPTGPLRVRMALHTGVTEQRAGDYVGPALNRIARLLNAGHGGQVLLSAATQELVRDDLPPGASLRDMGQCRLRDLVRPEHIYQLEAPDLPSQFPLLKTLEPRHTNLPIQPAPLIGRERELAQLQALLRGNEVRLLTLTGPGGIGKTRLALQLAAELLDDYRVGVFFVDLAPIREPQRILSAIAGALRPVLEVKEQSQLPLLQLLQAQLRPCQLLLVLDNFEQVIGAAASIAELLAAAPHLKVLVTSRIVLKLRSEHVFAVPPLTLPDLQQPSPLEQLLQVEAVRLFIERARDVQPDLAVTSTTAAAIAAICQRLDGLPLAIELAAARIRTLPPEVLLQRLGQRLRLLTGGPRDLPQRQQTLRNTIDWSYSLLGQAEQRLFRRLGVFVGGFSLEAAEAVCQAEDMPASEMLDGLAVLQEHSLLRQEKPAPGGHPDPRFVLLETLREYLHEQSQDQDELILLQQRHAAYYRALAQQAAPELRGPAQASWFARLELEQANLRAALAWLLAQGQPEHALALAADLSIFWYARGYLHEGRAWLERCLVAAPAAPASVRAIALRGLAAMYFELSEYEQAEAFYEQAGRLSTLEQDLAGVASALTGLGNIALDQGDYISARRRYEAALQLARQVDNASLIALILLNLGKNAVYQQQYDQALPYLEESSARFRALGDSLRLGVTCEHMGMAQLYRGALAAASACFEQALALYKLLDAQVATSSACARLGVLALQQQDYGRAGALLRQAVALAAARGAKGHVASYLLFLGCLAAMDGQVARAARLFGAAEALREHLSILLPPMDQPVYAAGLAQLRAQLDQATLEILWAAGRAMALDEAIADAVHVDSDVPMTSNL